METRGGPKRGARRWSIGFRALLGLLLVGALGAAPGQERQLRRVSVREDPPPAEETKKEGEEKKANGGEAKPAEKKKEPSPPIFRMRDGTRVAGTPDVQEVRIATAYGPLAVPVKDVFHIRFAPPQDPKLAGRIEELVRQLGSDEFDLREEATQALREIGAPALESLQKAAEAGDEEVKSRAEKLVAELEESDDDEDEDKDVLAPIRGADDEVRTAKFIAMGRVEQENFSVATPYGTLKLHRDDIVSLVFQEGPAPHAFEVGGDMMAAAGKWKDTGLKFVKGGKIRVKASGSVQMPNFNTSTGPEGTSNIQGNSLEKFPFGALVGKVSEKGKPFLIGSDYKGEADSTGTLFLGLSLRDGQASGHYDVKVEVED